MTAKALFLRNSDLAKYWVTIARDDRFSHVLVFAKSAMMEGNPTKEQIEGVERFCLLLETLADNEEGAGIIPTPGIFHEPDRMPAKPQSTA